MSTTLAPTPRIVSQKISLKKSAQFILAYDPSFLFTISVLRQLSNVKGHVRLFPFMQEELERISFYESFV